MGRVFGPLTVIFAGLVPLATAGSESLLHNRSSRSSSPLSGEALARALSSADEVDSCTLADCSEKYAPACRWLCERYNVDRTIKFEMQQDAEKTVNRIRWWIGKVIGIIAVSMAGAGLVFAMIFVQCADCWGDDDTSWRRFALFLQWREQRSRKILCSLLFLCVVLAGLLIMGAVLITQEIATTEQYTIVGDLLHQLLVGFHSVSDVVGSDGGTADWLLMVRNVGGAGSLQLDKFQGEVRVANNVAATFSFVAGATLSLAEGEENAAKLRIKGNSWDQWAAAGLAWVENLLQDKTTVTFAVQGEGKRGGSSVSFDATFEVPFADTGDWDSTDLFGSGMPYSEFVLSISSGIRRLRLDEEAEEGTLLHLGESSISMAQVIYIQLILSGMALILFMLFFFIGCVLFSRCCMMTKGHSERRQKVMERVKERQLQNYASGQHHQNGACGGHMHQQPVQMQGCGFQGQPQGVYMQQGMPKVQMQNPQVCMAQQQQAPISPNMIGLSFQPQGTTPQQMMPQQQFVPSTGAGSAPVRYMMPRPPPGGAHMNGMVVAAVSSGPDFRIRDKE